MQESNEVTSAKQEEKNIHNPARYEGESFEDYRSRRNESNAMAKANASIGQGKRTTRQLVRDRLCSEGKMKLVAGSYGKGLRNWINQKEAAKLANKE